MTSLGEAPNILLDELKWVHSLIRRDLERCRRLAGDVGGDASWDEIQAQVFELETGGFLFQLRGQCLRHCQFVHAHHGHEDAWMFPAVLEFAPRFAAVVDKLATDHRRISELLDTVELRSRQLRDHDGARHLLVRALDELSRHLLEHLAYEEEQLAPALAAWGSGPPSPRSAQPT
jgi:hypothetical protein